MTLRWDPLDLPHQFTPAEVHLQDGTVIYVADQNDKRTGWLYVQTFSGLQGKIPPHSVAGMWYLSTESNGRSETRPTDAPTYRITDDYALSQIRDSAERTDASDRCGIEVNAGP